MKLISRGDAKLLNINRYFTGKPCKHGHISERMINGGCIECSAIKCRNRYKEDPSKEIERVQNWRSINPDKANQVNKAAYDKKPEHYIAKSKRYKQSNQERVKAYNIEWHNKNSRIPPNIEVMLASIGKSSYWPNRLLDAESFAGYSIKEFTAHIESFFGGNAHIWRGSKIEITGNIHDLKSLIPVIDLGNEFDEVDF